MKGINNFVALAAVAASMFAAPPAAVVTGPASQVRATSVRVEAYVYPNGTLNNGDVSVCYGTSSAALAQCTPLQSIAGPSAIRVIQELWDLRPATRYYYRAQASTNPTSPPGQVGNFTTLAVGAPALLAVSPAGSYLTGIVPGALTSAYGELFADTPAAASSLGMELAGVSVTIGGIPAVVTEVGRNEVRFVTPPTLTVGKTAPVVVAARRGGQLLQSASVDTPVVAVNPTVFAVADGGFRLIERGSPLAADSDGLYRFVVVGSGWGAADVALSLTPAPGANGSAPARLLETPSITFDGVNGTATANVTFAGLMPGTVGINQMNVEAGVSSYGPHVVTLAAAGHAVSFFLYTR